MKWQGFPGFFRSYLFIRLALNALFLYAWISGTVHNFNLSGIRGEARQYLALHAIGYNTALLATLYINTLVLIPRLLFRKKYVLYAAGLLSSIALHTAILVFYREYITDHIPGVKTYDFSYFSAFNRNERVATWRFFLHLFYSSASFTVIQFSLVFLGQHFFIAIRQNELIRQQQTEMELAALKSQVNPHFLFNVLNSIYFLSLQRSEQAPELVMRLSELLRYMLYEAKYEFVPLKKEIQLLRDYTDIESMRLGKGQVLHFRCEDPVGAYQLAPLLLIPFVENAVKHGTNTLAEQAFIHIDIRVVDDLLYFSCSNNYKALPAQEHGGLGLANVRKRLQLLYPGRHELDIRAQNNIFDVRLSLQLNT